jgi:putative flippase GtrA
MSAQAGEFLRFLAVGAFATAIQYAVFGLLIRWQLLDPAPASGLGYLVGAAVSYVANRGITFGGVASHGTALLRFACMLAIAWLFTMAAMALLVHGLAWDPWMAQFATTGACLLLNYTASRRWVFRSASP